MFSRVQDEGSLAYATSVNILIHFLKSQASVVKSFIGYKLYIQAQRYILLVCFLFNPLASTQLDTFCF